MLPIPLDHHQSGAEGRIHLSRGLQQGDPISSYLFLICTEGLIALLLEAKKKRWISDGIRIWRGAPSISHLLFVNDSLIFYKSNDEENKNLQELLAVYGAMSGRIINTDKTCMTYGNNNSNNTWVAINALWGISTTPWHDRYLGLSKIVGKLWHQAFGEIKMRLWKKL